LLSLVQTDMKRLVAFTSINHLAYVMIAVGVAALATDPQVRRLAVNGATLQMISHGLLTGGMFLAVGLIQHRAGTRDLGEVRGLAAASPGLAALVALLAFGSLGLPGLSGFVAEFQVIGAALSWSIWIAAATILGLVIATAVYLRLVTEALLGPASESAARLAGTPRRDLAPAAILAVGSLVLGIAPGPLVAVIDGAGRLLFR
jgi:NADH-quinone oxidoreductase subunit M